MNVLDDRLREHFEMAGAMPVPPLNLDTPVERAHRRRRNRIVAVTVSAILAIAGVTGVISSLVGDDEGATRTIDQPDVPEDEPLDVGPEPIRLDPQRLVWSRVPHSNEVFAGGIETVARSVVAGGPGLVAVGVSGKAEVWTSVDGLNWASVAYNEETFGGADRTFTQMNSVIVGGPGLVAVGRSGSTLSTSPDEVATVWTSVDGLEWTRVPPNAEVFGDGGGAGINSVTAGGPGLVAVGWSKAARALETAPGTTAPATAAVWTSIDGLEWTRVPHDAEVFGGSGGSAGATMSSVAAGGPGLVAVGWHGVDAAAWWSTDGLTWTHVPHDEVVLDGWDGHHETMLSVTAGGPGLVAVGHRGVSAAAWWSTDGLEWTRVPYDEEVFGGSGSPAMYGAIAGGPGLIAVGSSGDIIGGGGLGLVWTSVDGLTWVRATDDESTFSDGALRAIAVEGSGLVAVGAATGDHELGQHLTAAVWTLSIGP